MPEGTGGSVEVKLDGAHLRVDARPARLVSLLRGAGGDPVLTAQREGGATHTEAVPSAARQVTFQVAGDLSVEATRGSDFVALAEASGRQVVVAFNGEVTVLPTGESGDRFALGAHEALLVPGDGTDPRVVPSDSLSDDDQDEISGAMEAAALGVTAASSSDADDAAGEPTQAIPAVDLPDAPTPTPTPTTPVATTPAASGGTSKAAGTTKKGPPVTPPQKRNPNKKGKRGRPQQVAKKQAPLVPAAAAGAAAGAAAAAGGSKKAGAAPAKKVAPPAKKATTKAAPAKGGGGRGTGGGGHDDSYEDTPGDRRFIIGAVVLAALVAIVLAVFVLTGDGDETDLAADGGTTTTEAEAEPETTTTAAPASTTTAVAAATSAAPSPTTTARPATTTTAAPATTTTAPATTTTARATTTTAAAAVAKYGIEPKSCVQNANNSITYTATIKNDSTAAFDYTIRVVFKDASGASAASSDASVTKLAAGKSVDFTATGTPSRNLANAGNCTVERVDARPSGS